MSRVGPIENMQEIGEHFQLIDQLTFLLIETSLDQSWAESKRVFKDIFTGSPPSLSPPETGKTVDE